jgi:cyclopropane fatty-acyl-phospholipid synthase-like methyltransferase
MVKSLLESPMAYEFSQFLWYRPGKQKEYVTVYAQAVPGEKVLDIGCGVGNVAQYFPEVTYHGFDSSDAYVRYARAKFGHRGQFTVGVIGQDVKVDAGSYDLVMANGVLHHLNDREALHLLALSSEALKPGGRLVTRDGCFEDDQSTVARFLLKGDRGKFVRTRDGYQRLVDQVFRESKAVVRRDVMRVPYSLIIFQCLK